MLVAMEFFFLGEANSGKWRVEQVILTGTDSETLQRVPLNITTDMSSIVIAGLPSVFSRAIVRFPV